MKRLFALFTVLVLSFSVFVPSGSVSAQSKEGLEEFDFIEFDFIKFELDDQIIVDESLLNGNQEFSIVEASSLNNLFKESEYEISPAYVSFTDLKVGVEKGIGGVRGSFVLRSPAPVRSVNIKMDFNYRESWLGFWTTMDTVLFSYDGGLGPVEENKTTYRTSTAGQYRVCVDGFVDTTKGRYNATGCSLAMSYDGKPY